MGNDIECEHCGGFGFIEINTTGVCPDCNGTGSITTNPQ